ncbi:MAG: hypothetical protein M3342_01085 [Bacteroidota bacterium]|nr:hypothetical protein [Bacteroidota bacterium]
MAIICLLGYFLKQSYAQMDLITNIPFRKTISLNGKWLYIVDPNETGFYNHRIGK